MDPHEQLNQLLADSGVSKIVYALVMPETEQTIDAVFDGVLDGSGPADSSGREAYHKLFREAWTQKQDAVHESFFETWLQWVSPIVELDAKAFPFRYPTAGASEGLREAIHAYAVQARQQHREPTVHLFDGEYEGFSAYACAAGIRVVSHRRKEWYDAIETIAPGDQFYISQPSALDGNVWADLDRFAVELHRRVPTAQLMLDLSYVGCVSRSFVVNANHPNIHAVFFSLSKPAGVYYHRIGGMFAREEYLGLFGNKWFKNISSLSIGTEFMRRYGVHELPTKYQPIQQRAIHSVNEKLGFALRSSDILLLGIGAPSPIPSELERYLLRGPEGDELVRVCLTARIAHGINPKLNPNVSARYYERIEP
jgi:hypothetical protein